MLKRLLAAGLAVVLAGVGILLVMSYANSADRRALEGMETQDVLVALESAPAGLSAAELADLVELKPVPKAFVVEGAVNDLGDLEGEVLTASLSAGEQLQRTRFSTPEDIRASGEVDLPAEAADLHQVTVALEKPRALGGNVTAGDTVGVFMSFDVQGQEGYELGADGRVTRTSSAGDESADDGDINVSTTHLSLHKVLVARVEGGYVAPPNEPGEEAEEDRQAQDTVNVTLALEAAQAEQLVFAMEFGLVWLSLEPATASEEGTGVVVVTIPTEARDVFQ